MAKPPPLPKSWRPTSAGRHLGLSDDAINALKQAVKQGTVESHPSGCGLRMVTLEAVESWHAAYTPGKRGAKPKGDG